MRAAGQGRWQVPALVVLCIVHALILMDQARRKSIGIDEGAHLAAGLAYWKWGEMSTYNLSPPLLRYVAAAPAWLSGAVIAPAKPFRDEPPGVRHWNYYKRTESENRERIQQDLVHGRLALVPLSLGAMLLVYGWASHCFNRTCAVVAAAMWGLSPTVLTAGSSVGTDVGAALFMGATVFTWVRYLETGRTGALTLSAVAAGLACASKFSGLLLFPLLLVLGLVRPGPAGRRGLAAGFLTILLVTFILVNAVYGFRLMGYRLDSFTFDSSFMKSVQRALPGSIPVPFHKDLVLGFDAQKAEAEGAYVAVLWDKAYFGGNWRYYPLSLLMREPIGWLAVAGLGVVLALIGVVRRGLPFPAVAAAVALAWFAVGMVVLAPINIGLRYLLPAYLPLCVLAGGAASFVGLRWIVGVVLPVAATEVWTQRDRLHAFRNSFAPPPAHVPNLDAGQSLIRLGRELEKHSFRRVVLLQVSIVDPSLYGIQTLPAEQLGSADALVISPELLRGVPRRVGDSFFLVRNWRELRHVAPVADLGDLLIYRAEDIPRWTEGGWFSRPRDWGEVLHDPAALKPAGQPPSRD
jgi:hypothetical protein